MKIIETDWKWKSTPSQRSSTTYIGLHHAAADTCSAADIDRWHKGNGWAGIGYHFFVRKDGSIYRGRPLYALGAHVSGKNSCSLGICAEGNYDKTTQMPQAQKVAIAELLNYLKSNFFPNAIIVGHRDIGSSACPGKYYPLNELKNYKNILKGGNTPVVNEQKEKEDLSMAQYEELKSEIQELREIIAERTGYYNYIDKNMNESYKPTIQRLVDEGIIKGNENGELMLTNDMMRVIVFCDRMINKN